MENSEIWKTIPNYNYLISNLGRIKNKFGKLLKGSYGKNYPRFGLYKNGIVKYFTLSRLVALTFISNPENKSCINHKDGNKKNNKVDNLEWVTYSENSIHAYKNGLYNTSKRRKPHKLNEFQKRIIRKCDLKNHEISKIFDVSKSYVSMFRNGKRN